MSTFWKCWRKPVYRIKCVCPVRPDSVEKLRNHPKLSQKSPTQTRQEFSDEGSAKIQLWPPESASATAIRIDCGLCRSIARSPKFRDSQFFNTISPKPPLSVNRCRCRLTCSRMLPGSSKMPIQSRTKALKYGASAKNRRKLPIGFHG